MKLRLGLVVLLVILAGCTAPAPDATPDSQTTTAGEPTTDVPTATVTTTEPGQTGVVGSIESTTVVDDAVVAEIAVSNYGTNSSTVGIAIRYVENNSFAKVGDLTVEPGQTETREVSLPTYGDDPANLTVQLRIDGTIVAERPATQ